MTRFSEAWPPTGAWQIPPLSDHCSVTGRAFDEGDVVFSCLIEEPEVGALSRRDLSAAAWEENRARLQPFSYWRSVYEPKAKPVQERSGSIRPGAAEQLLQHLSEQASPATEKARYFLALSLERKKVLRQAGREQVHGRSLLVYEHVATGELWLIPDPGVHLDEVSELEGEVRPWLEPEASSAPQATASA